MYVAQRGDSWWITNTPDSLNFGPYTHEKDAKESMSRLEQFYEHCDEPGFITNEEKP